MRRLRESQRRRNREEKRRKIEKSHREKISFFSVALFVVLIQGLKLEP